MLDLAKAARRGAAVGGLLVVLSSASAGAQVMAAPSPTIPQAQHVPAFLTRTDFSFLGAWLVTDDPRFSYDGRLTADIDTVDYGAGRTNLFVDYEMNVGSERRSFDVNHGNYTIELSSSLRTGPVELSIFFHHVSRHLADRSNPDAVSWNVIGTRASRRLVIRGVTVDASGDFGRAMQTAFVDYTWISDGRLAVRGPISRVSSLFASAAGELIGVDRSKYSRSGQTSGRVEAGLHVDGKKGAVEVFAGYERRADAFPTDLAAVRFFTVGVRLMTR